MSITPMKTWLFASVAIAAAIPLASHAAGLTVVRDAETGQLRAPTAAEAAALQGQQPTAQRSAGGSNTTAAGGRAPGEQYVTRSGAIGAVLPESTMMYSVAHVGPDGRIHRQCVQGDEHAHQALSAAPDFAKRPAMAVKTSRGVVYETE